jgi:hypothetical protein
MSDCNCSYNQGIYSTNQWHTNANSPSYNYACGHQQACNGCLDIIKSGCIIYTGSNLTNTGINQNDTLSAILVKLDALQATQNTINTNLLAAINDLNDRVNALETDAGIVGGGVHVPYTMI